MAVLIYSLGLFLTAFGFHCVVWKIRLPKNHSGALVVIFSGILAAGIGVLKFFEGGMGEMGLPVLAGPGDYFQVVAAYVSVTLAYVVTYSGIEVDSPSLVMVLEIHRAGAQGLGEMHFHQTMDNSTLVLPRVNDLIKGRLAVLEQGNYQLTFKGRMIAGLFSLYRKILGREEFGG